MSQPSQQLQPEMALATTAAEAVEGEFTTSRASFVQNATPAPQARAEIATASTKGVDLKLDSTSFAYSRPHQEVHTSSPTLKTLPTLFESTIRGGSNDTVLDRLIGWCAKQLQALVRLLLPSRRTVAAARPHSHVARPYTASPETGARGSVLADASIIEEVRAHAATGAMVLNSAEDSQLAGVISTQAVNGQTNDLIIASDDSSKDDSDSGDACNTDSEGGKNA